MEKQTKIKMWQVPKAIRKSLGREGDMFFCASPEFAEALKERYPMTHISVMHEYRVALKNASFYRLTQEGMRVVGMGMLSNCITSVEFFCKEKDGDLMVKSAMEGLSTSGRWLSVKTEGRK